MAGLWFVRAWDLALSPRSQNTLGRDVRRQRPPRSLRASYLCSGLAVALSAPVWPLCSVASDSDPVDWSPPGSSVHGDSPGKNTGVGRHFLLQGIFPTQGSNPGLPHGRQILHRLSHQGSPRRLDGVAYPFSRESSWTRNWTVVYCTAGGFFTSWATRKACGLTAGFFNNNMAFICLLKILLLPPCQPAAQAAATDVLLIKFCGCDDNTCGWSSCLQHSSSHLLSSEGVTVPWDTWD